MISTILPLPIGNAIRLWLEPPAGAVVWRVLRKGANTFAGAEDPSALRVYEGSEFSFLDAQALQNDVMQWYAPFWSTNGVDWTAGETRHATPAATYTEQTTDVVTVLRERLEVGLLTETQRGTFQHELGYVPVMVAAPSLERDLRFPMVTVHLSSEAPAERGIGDTFGQEFDAIGDTWTDDSGWLARVQVAIIGWSLNGDERKALREAIRRLLVGNMPVFREAGMDLVEFTQSDQDALEEYPMPLYQAVTDFSCMAPVRVCAEAPALNGESIVNLEPLNG